MKFGKTHDMEELIKLVASKDQELSKQLKSCEDLTKFAIGVRYPDAQIAPLTQDSIESAVKIAESVYDLLSKLAGI